MLIVRLQNGVTFALERSVGNVGKHGLWEFHRGESSYMRPPNYTPWRHAAVYPADPQEGQTVTLAVCRTGMPEEEWAQMGEGVARYESDR
ncbi:hypothetical protein ACFQDN_25440 [Pseudomonas asuensis]|jgi:hypothetical protein|uniref:Uncharacterized protein n=1 Tax=Pseudomonas asuensis TaxID=1825787 RepID=A0ABQ2GYN7_9PSED|nr:hypothetical protein [Pseudomonas asuensis]GGM17646.1 hypothetical protein GCM10009425_30760 [Pseudomonas asuensis]